MKSKLKKYLSEGVLIYQMGKVGSSSLEHAIEGAVQVHDFYYNPPCYVHRGIRYPKYLSYYLHRLSLVFKRNLFRLRRKVKIITIVRDPVQRNISMFFQSLPYWIIDYQTGMVSGRPGVGARVEGEDFLQDCYMQVFPHHYPSDWFDKELKKYCGIDVYSKPFDQQAGYSLFQNGRYEVLVLKLEQMSGLDAVISDFVGSDVKIAKSNSGDKKWYSPLYAGTRDKIVGDEAYVKELRDTKYYKHFYH